MNVFKNIYLRFRPERQASDAAGSLAGGVLESGPTLVERFVEQKQTLLSVSGDTESEFVSFGKEAGLLFSQAKKILSLVNEILETATGATIKEAVDLFEVLIADAEVLITNDQAEVETLIGEMAELCGQIESLGRHRDLIEDATRLPLGLLKIGFRVEGASRQQAITKILDAVGVEAAVLGKKVLASTAVQFSTLETASASMQKLVQSLRTMSEEVHRQHGETGDRIQKLNRHAGQLREGQRDQGQVGGEIEATGRALQRDFNRVVMALQYHDITRQQLEHVAEAFEATLPSAAASDAATPESAAMLHQTVKVQIHQTQAALASLKTAGKEFQQGMDQISTGANDLGQNVAKFRDLCRNEELFQALQGLAALQSMVDERTTIKRGVGEAACLIFEQVSDCTATINDLTQDLRILAINAQVQAANAEHHEVVEMLAKEMCDVSNAIRDAAQALTHDMEEVMKKISLLAMRAWKLGTHRASGGRTMHEEVPRCIEMLKGMQEKVSSGLGEADSLQADLQSRIAVLVTKIHFPEVASVRLMTVLQFFREIEAKTQLVGEHSEASMRALATMESNYTMASEREVHALAVAQSGLPVAPEIELFDACETPEPEVKSPTPKGDEFGDNVELF